MKRKTKDKRVPIRVTADDRKRWEAAAALDDRTLSDWMRHVLNNSAEKQR